MNTQRCPTCKKLGFEVYMIQGKYFTDCCQTELAPDFEEDREYE